MLIIADWFQIPITLHKETEINENGEEVMKCGFKIGGGIDQDFTKSPQGYTDNVRYYIFQNIHIYLYIIYIILIHLCIWANINVF